MEKNLKDLLSKERENNFSFADWNKEELLKILLDNLDDLDCDVRDHLINPNLGHLLHDKHFDFKRLAEITELLLSDQFLHFDLENKIDNSVLRRSYTSLQLVILIYVHNRDGLFTEEQVNDTCLRIIDYFRKESVS